MQKKEWLGKFRCQVANKLGPETGADILALVEDAEKLTKLGKARCIANAIASLEDHFSAPVVAEILQGCSCNFSLARLAAIQKIYQSSSDISAFICQLNDSSIFPEPIQLIGDWIVIDKKPYRADLKTQYPGNLISWYCHCGSIVKTLHGNISPAICQCGAGFYQPLFSALFGIPVRIEVRESLLQGQAQCVIAVQIPHQS
jgi:hypothetical protein